MRREEIIENTLTEMTGEGGLLHHNSGEESGDEIRGYVELVIAILSAKLPDADVQTCEDFQSLGVACCECCHKGYAHFDMELENLHGGAKAWLCCAVRGALREKGAILHQPCVISDDNRTTKAKTSAQEKTHE